MFRRSWSSLPKDVSFPTDLKGLGYFINEEDEIRSIENPDYYFKFFANKNARINERQRFAFNMAMEAVVHKRLEDEGMVKATLPLGAKPTEKHTPIFTTPDLATCSRIIVIFGEPVQDLGMLAGRIANGPGGVAKGTMISVVRAIRSQAASRDDSSPPGVVIANTGQRFWWPEGKRALTLSASGDTPMPSLVHSGKRYIAALNEIPGSESVGHHISTIFTDIVGKLPNHKAKIDIIAIGESCEAIENHFDNVRNWDMMSDRLNTMLLLGSVYNTDRLTNRAFKKFLAERTRGYILSDEPLDTPLAPPSGNRTLSIDPLGCPCYSSSESSHIEAIAIRTLDSALKYMQDLVNNPDFVNPPIIVTERPVEEFTEEEWSKLPEEEKPSVTTVTSDEMKKAVKEFRRWKRFEETGEAPQSDSDSEDENDDFLLPGKPQGRQGSW